MDEKKPNAPKPEAIQVDDFLDIPEKEQLERVEKFLRSLSQPKK